MPTIEKILLPETFPPEMVPPPASAYLKTLLDLELAEALEKTIKDGRMPLYKRLPKHGVHIFGPGITWDGLTVPAMVEVNGIDTKTLRKCERIMKKYAATMEGEE
jgi:hypothetical protein